MKFKRVSVPEKHHLTALEKRAVLAMLNAGATRAHTPKRQFEIQGETVVITYKETGVFGRITTVTHRVPFTAS